ncbi:dihydrofolate reductase family protein [Clostridium sp. 'White wine YQ']|uniref:dihydrofolate reductase family protein n=1 Tax=Clostridium sp. 'White wine YQ' TaxID=3027474 RepID=UPI002366FF48|nr:dihydrofolate reductase family protein [Clostridium sp. 'White wine YQ']MDD7793454.1 dihydrofolate reductase family protein [Clostridium sp. 'White wine YQ']
MLSSGNGRRIILDLAVTLDGFIEGPNGEVDWCIMDNDMGFTDFLNNIDTILYGRKSYELWGQYVPEDGVSDTEKEIWDLVHSKKKYVFSKTSDKEYNGANLISSNIVEKVKEIKNEPGKDIWLYGGASLITTFLNLGLVDEYRLSIHPIILGEGKPLFNDIKQRSGLKLISTKKFSSGVVQLCYHSLI